MKTKLQLLFVLFCFSITNVNGQESLLSSGGNASGSGGTSSYSVGQITYTSDVGSNGSVSQGVQQPFEIFILGVDEFPEIKVMMVFPNPTTEVITLKTGSYTSEALQYVLFDLNGREVKSQKITQSVTQIHLENLPPTIYFLKVLDQNKLLKTFRIIKNN